METVYRSYDARKNSIGEWQFVRRKSGKAALIGPTKASVSLVWMIGRKGGGK
jgi:hypothetical protein